LKEALPNEEQVYVYMVTNSACNLDYIIVGD